MEVPDSILEHLKCALCQVHLSHPPIFHNPSVGYICGRHPEQVANGIKFTEVAPEDVVVAAESDEDEILETIRCPICLEYMVPPIHQCILGHSFCDSCKPKLKKCATCRQSIGSTRNYTLEKVAKTVAYKCLYRTEGCTFKTTSALIRKHQASCKFRIMKCILSDVVKCDYVGPYAAIPQHCDEAHLNFVQKGPYFQLIYVPFFVNFEVFLIKFDFESIFKVRYGYNEDDVTCSVQCLCPPSDDTVYMYDMEIVDLNGIGFELTSKKMCANLSDDFEDMRFCSVWHIAMIKPFLFKRSQLKFKCTISIKN